MHARTSRRDYLCLIAHIQGNLDKAATAGAPFIESGPWASFLKGRICRSESRHRCTPRSHIKKEQAVFAASRLTLLSSSHNLGRALDCLASTVLVANLGRACGLQSVGRGAQALLRVGSFELTACRLSPDSSFCKQQYVEERLPKDLSRMM